MCLFDVIAAPVAEPEESDYIRYENERAARLRGAA